MKITKTRLKQLIQEELNVITEVDLRPGGGRGEAAGPVGLVTRVKGPVQVTFEGAADSRPAYDFVTVRVGDRYELRAGAVVEIVFFASGRREHWKGKVTFTLTASGGKAVGAGEPKVTMLPASAIKALRKMPPRGASSTRVRAGGRRVREGLVAVAREMKITKSQLKQLIKEELQSVLKERQQMVPYPAKPSCWGKSWAAVGYPGRGAPGQEPLPDRSQQRSDHNAATVEQQIRYLKLEIACYKKYLAIVTHPKAINQKPVQEQWVGLWEELWEEIEYYQEDLEKLAQKPK